MLPLQVVFSDLGCQLLRQPTQAPATHALLARVQEVPPAQQKCSLPASAVSTLHALFSSQHLQQASGAPYVRLPSRPCGTPQLCLAVRHVWGIADTDCLHTALGSSTLRQGATIKALPIAKHALSGFGLPMGLEALDEGGFLYKVW